MGNSKSRNNRIISVIGILFVIVSALLLWWYVRIQRQALQNMYEAQLRQTTTTVAATNELYRYVSLGADSKQILVQPKFQFTQDSGALVLVNKTKSIAMSYVPGRLTTVPIPKYQNDEKITVRQELIDPLKALYVAAQKEGISLMIRSAYRSSADQQALRIGAVTAADASYVAEPGQSEHQTGLAVDINSSPVYCQTCSLDSVSATWLAKNAPQYGFILRYPSDKVTITGYPDESWHYRYVGKDLALAMQRSNLAYEEVYPLFATAQPRGTK